MSLVFFFGNFYPWWSTGLIFAYVHPTNTHASWLWSRHTSTGMEVATASIVRFRIQNFQIFQILTRGNVTSFFLSHRAEICVSKIIVVTYTLLLTLMLAVFGPSFHNSIWRPLVHWWKSQNLLSSHILYLRTGFSSLLLWKLRSFSLFFIGLKMQTREGVGWIFRLECIQGAYKCQKPRFSMWYVPRIAALQISLKISECSTIRKQRGIIHGYPLIGEQPVFKDFWLRP